MTMHETKGTIASLRAIPREKLSDKIRKTVLGLGIVALSVGAAFLWGAPWWAGMAGTLLGATIWSGELVLSPIRLLGAVLVDLFRKATGKNGT
jgi:hypothetical protein